MKSLLVLGLLSVGTIATPHMKLKEDAELQERCKYLVDERDFYDLTSLAKDKPYRTVTMKVDDTTTQNVVLAFCRDIPE